MKITYRESGGFAGLFKGTEIDTEVLEPDKAHEVADLVKQSGIEGNTHLLSPDSRDTYQYEISIENDDEVKRALFDSNNMTDQVKPLISYLKKRARPHSPE